MVLTILCAALAYRVGVGRLKQKAAAAAEKPHSLVNYYGIYAGLWTLVPAVILALVWGFAADPLLMRAAEARLVASFPPFAGQFSGAEIGTIEQHRQRNRGT